MNAKRISVRMLGTLRHAHTPLTTEPCETEKPKNMCFWASWRFMVEVTGFEPATFWSRTRRATKLRYTSNNGANEETRTLDLLITNQLLCRLSYIGVLFTWDEPTPRDYSTADLICHYPFCLLSADNGDEKQDARLSPIDYYRTYGKKRQGGNLQAQPRMRISAMPSRCNRQRRWYSWWHRPLSRANFMAVVTDVMLLADTATAWGVELFT